MRFAILLIILFLSNVVFADVELDEQLKFKNDDFTIFLPGNTHFIQKNEQVEQYGKIMHAYLYEQDTNATRYDTPMQKSILSNDPYLNIIIFPLEANIAVDTSEELQRKYISMVHEGLKESLNRKLTKKELSQASNQGQEVMINGIKYQTYHFATPKMSIAYYTFVAKKNLYFIQALYLPEKQHIFNDSIVKEALKRMILSS